MFDLRKYWQEIRMLEETLPQFLWIVDAAGTLIEVTAKIAAKMLHAKSHRVATEQEIHCHIQRTRVELARSEKASRERGGVAVVALERED